MISNNVVYYGGFGGGGGGGGGGLSEEAVKTIARTSAIAFTSDGFVGNIALSLSKLENEAVIDFVSDYPMGTPINVTLLSVGNPLILATDFNTNLMTVDMNGMALSKGVDIIRVDDNTATLTIDIFSGDQLLFKF